MRQLSDGMINVEIPGAMAPRVIENTEGETHRWVANKNSRCTEMGKIYSAVQDAAVRM
jgi:aerobic-type carbon monoxide dehydrogenase small subunit (CoxS/CutS family)